MKSYFIVSILVFSILLTACGEGVFAQPTATLPPPTATYTPTVTATPEPTFTPTATPTPRLPVSLGTQFPVSGSVISADNIDQVVELARWGKGVITDAVYSADGKTIAVATTLGVSLYQADTLDEILYFETGAGVNSLVYSPDGKAIATGLNDNTVKLWNASDGTLLQSIDGHVDEKPKKGAVKPEVASVSFSPDGSILAGGSTDSTVSIWQVSDGSLINTFKGHTKSISSVFFSPDGQALFSASWDGKVRMVEVASGEIIRSFSGQYLHDAAISADGKTIAAYDHRVYISPGSLIFWNVETGEKINTIKSPADYVITSIALSSDGQNIAAALRDHTVKVWSVTSGVLQNTFEDLRPKDGWYYLDNFAVTFSPDGQSLLLAGTNAIGLWDLKGAALINSANIKSQGIQDIELSPEGEILASVDGPDIRLLRFSDGSLQLSQDLLQSNGNVNFSPDGSTLLASMFDNTVQLWPLSEQGLRKSFESEKKEYIGAVAFSPDGQTFALLERYTGKVELRQVSDGALIKSMKIGTSYGFDSLLFTPDGKYLVAALNDQVRLFSVEDGKSLRSFGGGLGIALSSDGLLLAGGGMNKALTVWNIPGGDVLFTVKDGPDEVRALTFSPDGKFLVAGFFDGTIEVLDASNGSLLRSWKGHTLGVTDILFTSDGKQLITSSWDGTIRVWGVKP